MKHHKILQARSWKQNGQSLRRQNPGFPNDQSVGAPCKNPGPDFASRHAAGVNFLGNVKTAPHGAPPSVFAGEEDDAYGRIEPDARLREVGEGDALAKTTR